MSLKVKKIIGVAIDIILITIVFSATDHLMLKVIKSDNILLELGIYLLFYAVVFGAKSGIKKHLWKRSKKDADSK